MGGLGAAGSVPVGRSYTVHERGGGPVTPWVSLLHVLLGVVFYDVAVVVSLHRGGATGRQVTQREPWTLFPNSRTQLMEKAEAGRKFKGSLPVDCKDL